MNHTVEKLLLFPHCLSYSSLVVFHKKDTCSLAEIQKQFQFESEVFQENPATLNSIFEAFPA